MPAACAHIVASLCSHYVISRIKILSPRHSFGRKESAKALYSAKVRQQWEGMNRKRLLSNTLVAVILYLFGKKMACLVTAQRAIESVHALKLCVL